ncbi:UDP-N-acetylmuramate dehydrogenase [Patescibacteria group bacterium]|nr:UDP-N-acetylmuramate dehydrogenase [Patescibacteria group bacterium]
MEDIKKILHGIKENVLMAGHTTFKIGGQAKFFFGAKNQKGLIKAIKAAKLFNLPFFILGSGSNILVSDKGYKGLVIKFQVSSFKFQKNKIIAGAGTKLRELVNTSTDKELTGLEWAVGIPGTVGAAVYGNVGAFGSSMADSVHSIKALDIKTLKIKTFSNKECRFGNKSSVFKKKKNLVILSVILELKKRDKEEIQKEIKRFSDYRKRNHPLNFPSAGCVFKNYAKKIKNKNLLKKFPELNEFNKGSRIPTSYLIDKCGLKGKVIGKAKISEKHANFIVNLGGAKTKDVVKLIKIIKKKIKEKFGIELKEEIQYLK